jgi:hypothetical protein
MNKLLFIKFLLTLSNVFGFMPTIHKINTYKDYYVNQSFMNNYLDYGSFLRQKKNDTELIKDYGRFINSIKN